MTAAREWRFAATYVHTVDGDTVDLCCDLGFRIAGFMRFRLLAVGTGLDTPEKTGRTRSMGLAALAYVDRLISAPGAELEVLSLGEVDKYGGRWDARISLVMQLDVARVRVDLGDHLIRFGFAQPYDGKGARPTWNPDLPYPLPAARRWRQESNGGPWLPPT